jgi:hypothetical protein
VLRQYRGDDRLSVAVAPIAKVGVACGPPSQVQQNFGGRLSCCDGNSDVRQVIRTEQGSAGQVMRWHKQPPRTDCNGGG